MKKPARKSRQRLPARPSLLLDEKLVNMLRAHRLFADALNKPQKPIHAYSLFAELSDIEQVIAERLAWHFAKQYPQEKFIWGAVKKGSTLPDEIPKDLQPERRFSK